MTSSIEARLPANLLCDAQQLVDDGWATDLDALLADALRRYLDAHSARIQETFLKADVEWGLHGSD